MIQIVTSVTTKVDLWETADRLQKQAGANKYRIRIVVKQFFRI